jgi:hypothetical protein
MISTALTFSGGFFLRLLRQQIVQLPIPHFLRALGSFPAANRHRSSTNHKIRLHTFIHTRIYGDFQINPWLLAPVYAAKIN